MAFIFNSACDKRNVNRARNTKKKSYRISIGILCAHDIVYFFYIFLLFVCELNRPRGWARYVALTTNSREWDGCQTLNSNAKVTFLLLWTADRHQRRFDLFTWRWKHFENGLWYELRATATTSRLDFLRILDLWLKQNNIANRFSSTFQMKCIPNISYSISQWRRGINKWRVQASTD